MSDIIVDENLIENVYEIHYFKLTKQLQRYIGLWPYKVGFIRKIQRIVVYMLLISGQIPFVNGIRVSCGTNLDICCENIAGGMFLLVISAKYIVTSFCEEKLKNVYQRLTKNWLTITDPEEQTIISRYAGKGKIKAVSYFAYMYTAGFIFSQMPLIPVFMDFVMPLNRSRQKILFVRAEFIFDPFEHYYKLYVYYGILALLSVTTVVSIDSSYTVVAHQTLGIFSIVKHRLNMVNKAYLKKNQDCDTIVKAIRLHKEAIEFIDSMENSYSILFLAMILFTVLFLSIGAIVGMRNKEDMSDIIDLVRLLMIQIGSLIHLFYLSWPGQLIFDHSEELFLSAYLNEWYHITERGKTLLKIFMLRCMRPCVLTAGGLYVMNFQNYGAVVKTTLSYMTVAISLQE